jgi:Cu(I)/Ag(I) efflux system membrane fusion protein
MTDAMLRRLSTATLVALLACGGGMSEPARVEGGGMTLEARVAPAELRVGENEMEVVLRDAQGRPVEDAHVSVEVRMHAMGAMPAMGGPAKVEALGDGRYAAQFRLEMGGTWLVGIQAHRPSGGSLAGEGSLTIGTPGLRLQATSPPGHSSPREEAASAAEGGARSEPEASEVEKAEARAQADATRVGESPRSEHPGEFRFDEARLRQVGVRSEPARREQVETTVRAAGRVVVDETRLHDVTVRIGGFVGEVEANALGEPVEKGQVLFRFYAPDLHAAQREYLEALRSQAAARGTSAAGRADPLVRAAAARLRLWGIDEADVAAIARRGTPEEYLPVRAPVAGFVVEKEIVAGSPVEMGQRVYRIAPLDRVWIEAEVFEAEVPLVEPGMPAEVTLPYLPGARLEAKVGYVYPRVQEDRRTARVRLEIANPKLALRPDMYADVFLRRPLGPRLTVPDTAVLHAGDRDFVFLDLGDGRLRPQRVTVGIRSGERLEILAGLEEGQPVVVSGTFLVASESRLRAALDSW